MEIAEQIKEHDVVDYDFMFVGGSKLSITIDLDAGDVIEELPDRYVLSTVAKPSLTDPDEIIEAETVEVMKRQLAVRAICKRKQRVPSMEEMLNAKKLIHAIAKQVQ